MLTTIKTLGEGKRDFNFNDIRSLKELSVYDTLQIQFTFHLQTFKPEINALPFELSGVE